MKSFVNYDSIEKYKMVLNDFMLLVKLKKFIDCSEMTSFSKICRCFSISMVHLSSVCSTLTELYFWTFVKTLKTVRKRVNYIIFFEDSAQTQKAQVQLYWVETKDWVFLGASSLWSRF